jgi:Peptidase C13 family
MVLGPVSQCRPADMRRLYHQRLLLECWPHRRTQHRVVIVSACYSGVFVGPLANDNTLVITAAYFDHSSFGCQDKVKWTYFGDAFFNRALRHHR